MSCYVLGVAVTQEGVAEHYVKGQHKVHCTEINNNYCGKFIMAKLVATIIHDSPMSFSFFKNSLTKLR